LQVPTSVPPFLDVELEQVRLAARHQVQRGRDDELVLGKILGGPREIHGHIAGNQVERSG